MRERRDARDKLRVVMTLSDDEVGAFLRREGAHEAELEQWRSVVLDALGDASARASKSESKACERARA